MKLRNLAILGPGLLGGSLLLAARRRGLAERISVWARRDSALDAVRRLAAADLASNALAEVVAEADMVVVCTPVDTVAGLAERALPHLTAGALVTDVGSVKHTIATRLDAAFAARDAQFVGSHPMAGSEQSGIESASADLYTGALAIVTPTPRSDHAAARRVHALWKALGCRTCEVAPAEHDRIVATISHLPHLAAAALVLAARDGHDSALDCLGNGFLDTTRIASGPEALWRQIVAHNKPAILQALGGFIDSLGQLRHSIDTEDWRAVEDFLGKARQTRDNIRQQAR